MASGRRIPFALAACAALALPLDAWSQTASAQTSQPTSRPTATVHGQIDVLPDVTVRPTRRRFPDEPPPPLPPVGEENIIVQRLPRLIGCFTADAWSPDPTAKFNQAYYEELTGDADYFARIRTPAPRIEYHYFGAVHDGERAFANLGPGVGGAGMGGGGLPSGRPPRTLQTGYRNCGNRTSMAKDTTFARGLAMFDKGEFAEALVAFEAAYERVRNSQMAGEIALMIAGMYQEGVGAPRDIPRAIEWLIRANGAPLRGAAGSAYSPGRGAIPRYDPGDPDHYYTIAAEASMKLSLIYLRGDGVAKDEVLTRRWVESAARQSHVPALKISGDMYYAGFGAARNLRSALLLYEGAARANHIPAVYAAAEMYDLGEGTKPDHEKALQYYGRAALAGHAEATLALAIAYDTGAGMPADPQKAIALYKIAALAGLAPAQTALGTYFYKGEVVEKDHATARAWFEAAAIRGEPDAMVNLAAMLAKGEGGEADPVKAWAWLSIARESGRDDVAGGMAALEGRMNAADLAAAKALIAPVDAEGQG